MNKLYYGDNYGIMETKIEKQSIDLIYLDPPFSSKKNYNIMYRNMTGQPVPEQVEAFCDAWTMDEEKQRIASTIPLLLREIGADDEYIAFWQLWMKSLGKLNSPLMAYLIYMVPRLCRMKGILKPTGSIYLHCDPTASHYLKIMMDGIFGEKNYRNEIIWSYKTSVKVNKYHFGKDHDVILFYTNGGKPTFHPDRKDFPASEKTLKRWAKYADSTGFVSNINIERTTQWLIHPMNQKGLISIKVFQEMYGIYQLSREEVRRT